MAAGTDIIPNSPALCTAALQEFNRITPQRSAALCTGSSECQRQYSLAIVNCSAHDLHLSMSSILKASIATTSALHELGKSTCIGRTQQLSSGGWCLAKAPEHHSDHRACQSSRMLDSGCFASTANKNVTYWLPPHHYTPDGRIISLLAHILSINRHGFPRSLVDIGAGVGQTCRELMSRDRQLSCTSYDGAGNVEAVSNGVVHFLDLTAPILDASFRADWALSLEVGEHVPNAKESMLIRNLHAVNRCGIVLSWGSYTPGKRGKGDANYHTRSYLVGVFRSLGYLYLADLAPKWLASNLTPRRFWFDQNLVGVFIRNRPIDGTGCGYSRLV